MFKLHNKHEIKDSGEVIKSVNKKTSVPSIVNAEMFVKGDISSENIIEVFGKIDGKVKADIISIREGASVKGSIVAQYVKISGTFDGDIKSAIIHITSTGVVNGKLAYGILSIEEKAKFDGTLMQSPELLTIKDITSEEVHHRKEVAHSKDGAREKEVANNKEVVHKITEKHEGKISEKNTKKLEND